MAGLNERPLSLSPSPHPPLADGERDGVWGDVYFTPALKRWAIFLNLKLMIKLHKKSC